MIDDAWLREIVERSRYYPGHSRDVAELAAAIKEMQSALGQIAEMHCRNGECTLAKTDVEMAEIARSALGLLPLFTYNVVSRTDMGEAKLLRDALTLIWYDFHAHHAHTWGASAHACKKPQCRQVYAVLTATEQAPRREDVAMSLAHVILGNYRLRVPKSERGGANGEWQYTCRYCGHQVTWTHPDYIEHKPGCPYLLAASLLSASA